MESFTAAGEKAGRTFLQQLNRFDTPTIDHSTAWIAGCATVDQSLIEFKTVSHILLQDIERRPHESLLELEAESNHRQVPRHLLSEIKQAAAMRGQQ